MADKQEDDMAIEKKIAAAQALSSGGGGGSGTNFVGEQVKDGRLTPEYQDALSSRFEQLGNGNPFTGASGGVRSGGGAVPPVPPEVQIALSRLSPGGMNFSFSPPVGFSA